MQYSNLNVFNMSSPMTFRILVIEDEIDFREALVDLLKLKGFDATGIDSIASYQKIEDRSIYQLIILDRTLPDGDGLEILKAHRAISDIPVIILSGLGDTDEIVTGLSADADYYLVKPVVMPELLAIVSRYSRKQTNRTKDKSQNWCVSLRNWQLKSPQGMIIPLSHSETLFLNCFKDSNGAAVDREDIVVMLGHRLESYDMRRLESLVSRLRNKVKDFGIDVFPLSTVYGSGYAFNEPLVIQDDVV